METKKELKNMCSEWKLSICLSRRFNSRLNSAESLQSTDILRVYIVFIRSYIWELSIKTVFYFYLRSITSCSCVGNQQTVSPYLTFPCYSWLYGPHRHFLLLVFLSMLKGLSLGVSFRILSIFSILLCTSEKKQGWAGLCTLPEECAWHSSVVGISSICCFDSKPLLISHLCAWPLLSIEAEAFKVKSISTFKSFFP